MYNFTSTQKQILSDFKRGKLARINLLVGAVRSGKTYISLILWALLIGTYPEDGHYLMMAKTLTNLKRNCLDLLCDLIPGCEYSLARKEMSIFGRKVYLEGANDSRAESKIRGMTLTLAYVDEVTQVSYDVFTMLLSRLSEPGAKLIGTTNPDTPYHWLYTDYIARKDELDFNLYTFNKIEENHTLTPEYIAAIKREYTGVYYDRFISGKWVSAEGLIYRIFADNNDKYIYDNINDNIAFVSVGIDYGASRSKTVFIATGFTNNFRNIYILEEHTLEGVHEPEEINNAYISFARMILTKYGNISYCMPDYGALGEILILSLRNRVMREGLPTRVIKCTKGTINDRIQLTCKLFAQGRLHIHNTCKGIIKAFNCAVWEQGKNDCRLDDGTVDVDYLDAFEYSFNYFSDKIIRTGI